MIGEKKGLYTLVNDLSLGSVTIFLKYLGESKVLQYFSSLFVLFFKLQQKQPRIQSRDHCVALTPLFCQFLSFKAKNSFTEGYWSVMRTESEPWIGTGNNARILSLVYTLSVASVLFLQVPRDYSGNEYICKCCKTFDSAE